MLLSELEAFVATLCNDPSNARYTKSDIDTELDNTQGQWNAEIRIIKSTTTLTVIANQRQYDLGSISGTPISFARVTHKGIDLQKRSKSYFDLYTHSDWTQNIGTPTEFVIEIGGSSYIDLYPTPQSGDEGNNLVIEAVIAHTPMVTAIDSPFNQIYFLRPYDFYVGYSAAARLLARDPSPENQARAGQYLVIAGQG
jgi:hypothetical protein